jgi:hypothetical protein
MLKGQFLTTWFDPRSEVCPLGLNLFTGGEFCPLGGMFTPSGDHSLLFRGMVGQIENFSPGAKSLPLGNEEALRMGLCLLFLALKKSKPFPYFSTICKGMFTGYLGIKFHNRVENFMPRYKTNYPGTYITDLSLSQGSIILGKNVLQPYFFSH